MFKNKAQDVLDKHITQITPEGYTFMIWILIFGWLLGGYIFRMIYINLIYLFTTS